MNADDFVFACADDRYLQEGLLIKDYIAIEMAKAIITVNWNELSMATIAESAYRMADEMIKRS